MLYCIRMINKGDTLMKKRVALIFIIFSYIGLYAFEIEKITLPSFEISSVAYTVSEGSEFWENSPTWTTEDGDVSSKGFAAITEDAFLFRVEVSDKEHNNDFSGRNMWRGDCIYIGIDSRGDTDEDDITNKRYGNDDATYCFAKSAIGDEVTLTAHGDPDITETSATVKITRDEEKSLTIYDIKIPFSELNTAYGISDNFGLAVTIAHKNSDKKDQGWGRMRDSKKDFRLYNRIGFPRKGDISAHTSENLNIYLEEDIASVLSTVYLKGGGEYIVSLGGKEEKIGIGKAEYESFRVSITEEDTAVDKDSVTIYIKTGFFSKKKVAEFSVKTPKVTYAKAIAKLSSLAEKSESIGKGHLVDTMKIISDAYERIVYQREEKQTDEIALFIEKTAYISTLPDYMYDFDERVKRGIPSVFAFVSERDYSIQFYMLQFPYNWDETKEYPLSVYLHGHGDNNPIGGLYLAFDCAHQDTLFTLEEIDSSSVPPIHNGFVLAPWGRGNSGYKNEGEDDVLQSLREVTNRFKIAQNRIYMSGFSMGCSGAFSVVSRTPDIWAGVNLSSGFGVWSEVAIPHLRTNIAHLPIKVWIGDLDYMKEGALEFVSILEKEGFNFEFTLAPNLPHTYPYPSYNSNMAFLMNYTREIPNKYRFITGDTRHQGAFGITINVARHILNSKDYPEFSYTKTENKLIINSKNTDGIAIDLTETGLNFTQEVSVVYNGEEIYKGKPSVVKAGARVYPERRRY